MVNILGRVRYPQIFIVFRFDGIEILNSYIEDDKLIMQHNYDFTEMHYFLRVVRVYFQYKELAPVIIFFSFVKSNYVICYLYPRLLYVCSVGLIGLEILTPLNCFMGRCCRPKGMDDAILLYWKWPWVMRTHPKNDLTRSDHFC